MTGENSTQDWDAYPPGTYVPPAPPPEQWQPYGPPPGPGQAQGYGPPVYWPPAPLPWPHGPGRPGAALTAAVLGYVTGGLTLLVSLIVLLAVTDGEDDAATVLMLLGLPCAFLVLSGAAALMSRGSPALLFGGALASVGVLLLVGLVGAAIHDRDTVLGMFAFGVFALPLPVLTAIFARLPVVRGWAAGG